MRANENIAIVIESGLGTFPGHGVRTFIEQLSLLFNKKIDLILKHPKHFYHSHDTMWGDDYIKGLRTLGKLYFASNSTSNIEYCLEYQHDWYNEFCVYDSVERYIQNIGEPKIIFFNFFRDVSICADLLRNLTCEKYYFCHEGIIYNHDFHYGEFSEKYKKPLMNVINNCGVKMLVPNTVISDYLNSVGLKNYKVNTPIQYNEFKPTNVEKQGVISIGCDLDTKNHVDTVELFTRNKCHLTILTNAPENYTDTEYVKFKYVENRFILNEIVKHKVMIHNSSTEMMPYALLEAAPYIPIIVKSTYNWSKGLPFFVNRSDDIIKTLKNESYNVELFDSVWYNKSIQCEWSKLMKTEISNIKGNTYDTL